MTDTPIHEELDNAINLLASDEKSALHVEPGVRELVEIAADLQHTPRRDFKAQLASELQDHAVAMSRGANYVRPTRAEAGQEIILPTLFGQGYGNYPVQRSTFVISFFAHCAAVVLLATSSLWIVTHNQELKQVLTGQVVDVSPYILPPAKDEAGGGGGGGDRDKLAASKGALPKFSREQITPPAAVVRNEAPKLEVPPTVVVPPNINLPQVGPLGDPMSNVLGPASNGPGSGGGIGSGSGGGVGSGRGPGVGPGYGGGIGGGVYRVGGGVSAPRTLYSPDPEYSDEARLAKFQGTVILWAIIGTDGRVHDMRVARSLGMGLDQKALEAVRVWRFEPAQKDGRAVAVQVNIEVNFHLY